MKRTTLKTTTTTITTATATAAAATFSNNNFYLTRKPHQFLCNLFIYFSSFTDEAATKVTLQVGDTFFEAFYVVVPEVDEDNIVYKVPEDEEFTIYVEIVSILQIVASNWILTFIAFFAAFVYKIPIF